MTRPTVLIVDDALLFQAGLAAAFDDEGFDVVARASDAMSAVSMARRVVIPGRKWWRAASSPSHSF